jgi:LacI family transcriptional regulator
MPSKRGYATIADVARAAGVSVSSVSRVINGKGDVSAQTREAVLRAMAATSYAASPVARSLVGGKTRLLGLHCRQLTDDYAAGVIRGVLDVAEAAGYGVLLFAGGAGGHDGTAPLLRTLPDGVLVISPTMDAAFDPGSDGNRPVVFVERRERDGDWAGVTVTDADGEAELTRYLLDLGHRRIGYITGRLYLSSARARLASFKATLAAAAVPLDEDLIVEGHYDQSSGLAAARHLLALSDPPTAIVAANDLEAFGVLRAAHEAGVRVPDQLSVVGFDDVPMAEHVHPPLTTVHQPLDEIGRAAAEMLIRWVEGTPPDPRQVVLATRLVIRGSGAAPAPERDPSRRELGAVPT